MKRLAWLRHASAALLWTCAAAALADCPKPPAPAVWVERFVSADCLACWGAEPPAPAGTLPERAAPAPLAIDWIAPGRGGEQAPLAAAAMPEALARSVRAGGVGSDEALTTVQPLQARRSLELDVADGIALNGYIGLSLSLRYRSTRALPVGLVAYVALVERVPAGEEGTPVERLLVRSVAGPLELAALSAQRPLEHRLAARLPDTRRPERLTSVAWVETAKGRVLAAAAAAAPCTPR